MEEKKRIYCKNCKNYHVTWDVKFPNGCKLFGMKTQYMPSVLVYQSTGKNCEHYEQK